MLFCFQRKWPHPFFSRYCVTCGDNLGRLVCFDRRSSSIQTQVVGCWVRQPGYIFLLISFQVHCYQVNGFEKKTAIFYINDWRDAGSFLAVICIWGKLCNLVGFFLLKPFDGGAVPVLSFRPVEYDHAGESTPGVDWKSEAYLPILVKVNI